MKRHNVIIIILAIIAILFLALLLDARQTIQYDRESFSKTSLNYEANEFCLRIALAYCTDNLQMIQDHNSGSLELPESLAGADMAIIAFQQTKYVSNSAMPYAAYAIDYFVTSSSSDKAGIQNSKRSVRQIIQVTKDLTNNRWMFEVLSYEDL